MPSYDIDKMHFKDLESSIKVPTYQRPVVWTTTERNSFISSLHQGFPFGSLLLYKYPDDRDGRYTLIDGQQRYTTMRDYINRPFEYFPIGEYDFVKNLLEITHVTDQSIAAQSDLSVKYQHIVEKMLKDHSASSSPLKPYYLRNEIFAIYPAAKEIEDAADNLLTLQQDIIDEFDSYLDLDSIVIPCIIYRGSEGNLPEVFARVNLGGRKLTKYQVFKAQWNRYHVCLESGEQPNALLEDVVQRYQDLTDDRGGLEIEDFDANEMRESRKITLPEFCHALGQEILRTSYAVWPKSTLDQDDAVDTIGYNSLAIVFGIKPQKINTLAERYFNSELENSPERITKMIKSVLGEYSHINQQFARYLRKPGPSGQGGTPAAFENAKAMSQHQFLSFFAALWRIRYGFQEKPTFEPLPHCKTDHERTLKNLFGSYLIDYLGNQWKGSGDSRLASYIEGTRNYLSGVTRESVHSALSDWWNQEKSAPSINIDTASKVLLTVCANANPQQYKDQSYDFEHIIARKWLNEKDGAIPRYKALSLPGGRLGNVMFLSSSHNRHKGANSIGLDAFEELDIIRGRSFLPNKGELKEVEFSLRSGNPDPFLKLLDERSKAIFQTIETLLIP